MAHCPVVRLALSQEVRRDDGRTAMIDLLLVLLVANGEVGQNAWCWVSMSSGTAFL